MLRQSALRLVTLAAGAMLAACGGSDRNSAGGGNDTGTTPPDTEAQPVLKASTAQTVGIMVVGSAEAALMFADEASLALRKFDGTTLYQTLDNCRLGSARYLLTDNDQDRGLSVGDQIRVDFDRCSTPATGGTLSGDLLIFLDEIDADSGTDNVRYTATVDASALVLSDGELITVEQPMTVEFRRDIYESQLTVSGDVDVSLIFPSSGNAITADWQSMTITKWESYETATYAVSMTGAWQSNILTGATQISTAEPLTGALNTWPTSGRIEVAGADGSGLGIRSDGLGPGDFAIFAIDEDGDGVFVDLDETLDWGDFTTGYLWWFELSSPFEFGIRSYDPGDFRILTWRPHDRGESGFEPTAPNPTIRILTSRAIEPTTVPDSLRLASLQDDWPFIDTRIDTDVEVRGAMILVRPLQQLAFGAPYRFPEQPFTISDLNGNTLTVSDLDSRIRVVDDLVAATDPEEIYGFPGDQVNLGSAGSRAATGSISSFDWSQEIGTAALIAGADRPSATITLPTTAQTELLRVNLQVTNDSGEVDYAKTDITLFPALADIDLVYVRALLTTGEWQDWLLTPANGEQQYALDGGNRLLISHATDYVNTELEQAYRQDWQIDIASPSGTELAPGSYDNISSSSGGESEAGLSVSGDPLCLLGSGAFEVLAFTTDATGQPDTVAIDFTTQCAQPGEFERVEGFVRLRSDLPIN